MYSRDINGRLDYNVFLKVVDLYSDLLGFDSRDKLELMRKAQLISAIEENHRSNEMKIKKNSKIGSNSPKTLGSKRK